MNVRHKILGTVLLAAMALSGCTATSEVLETSAPTSPAPVSAEPSAAEPKTQEPSPSDEQPVSHNPAAQDVMAALEALPVMEEQGSDTYDRELFNHWVDNNDTGCDTRFAVLVQESTVPAETSGCKVLSGNWVSSYDGKVFTDPGDLDIDHMVPLKEAWESGAFEWDETTREAYANDMSYSNSLIAVSASSNRSKSDRDPASWLPSATEMRCEYVVHWITVKTRWKLGVDAAEKSAIQSVLTGCESGMSVEAEPAPVVDAAPAPAENAEPQAAAPVGDGQTDPNMGNCKAAKAAGYGPYSKGEPEYEFYRDGDGDGTVCE